MKIAIITLAGENITDSIAHLAVSMSMNNHCHFTLHYSEEDRAGHFIGTLSASSKRWIGKPFEVVGLFKGIVTSVSISRVHGGKTNFIIQGQSPTILLDDGPHTRSFGEKTLQEILDKVMEPYEGGFEGVDIKPQMGKIKYCVQYKESNFAFMNRLSARYGEWFYYDGQKLNFGKAPSGGAVRLNFPIDVIAFDIAVKAVPVNFKLKTYDYKKHEFPSKKSDYSPPSNEYAKIAFDKSKGEIFPNTSDVPINIGMDEGDLEKIKKLRENVHLSELVVLNGTSRFTELKLGSIIKVVDNREDLKTSGTDDYGEYIITRLSHEFTTRADIYTNHFEAIPKDSKVPPLSVAPDPPYCEIQEAEVVENNDKKAMGRIRVQFHWQKELSGDDSKTNWIRVVSNSASSGSKGLYILPEIKDTVLVAFEHDNPERPYVLTSTYHGTEKPEHHDPKNWKKALKTKGGHQFLMNDEKGKEKMDFFSPKDFAAMAKAGQMDLKANKTITIISDSGKITINTPDNIAIDSSKTNITITALKGKITIQAKEIEIEGEDSIKLKSKKIDIEATMELNANAPKVTIEGKATADLKGLTVSIDGSTLTNVKGGIVKIN
jgi:type VI secretion system secreted protein VgrG